MAEIKEALEKAADYIWNSPQSFGCEMSADYFQEGDRNYRNVIGSLTGVQQSEKGFW